MDLGFYKPTLYLPYRNFAGNDDDDSKLALRMFEILDLGSSTKPAKGVNTCLSFCHFLRVNDNQVNGPFAFKRFFVH